MKVKYIACDEIAQEPMVKEVEVSGAEYIGHEDLLRILTVRDNEAIGEPGCMPKLHGYYGKKGKYEHWPNECSSFEGYFGDRPKAAWIVMHPANDETAMWKTAATLMARELNDGEER